MKQKILTALLMFGIVANSFAQVVAADKFYVQFTNKSGSIYSIDHPEDFLTQRAIDRRSRFGIMITENDIPVNANYVQGVAAVGVEILNSTKWFNGVTIYTNDTNLLSQIRDLEYVSSIVETSFPMSKKSDKFKNIILHENDINNESAGLKNTESMDYGYSFGQIDQLNGIMLHDEGFMGQGMVIAVLDAGFSGALTHPILDYLWQNNKILGSKDFVYIGGSVFNDSEHGKMVLSCMGGNLPGEMIGTAPEADYWLLRSEEAPHENLIEEYNWMSAAEFADSVGADVINSSLGYIDFDTTIFNHPYSAMNGNTTVISRAADIAATKGMLVVNSAGNSGDNTSFPWIGAPADGDSVFTIGAVNLDDQRASFSSIGPTADGRIKPLVMACGQGATIAVGTSGYSTWGNGTSFSSPIMAGMSTCLWQAHPEMTAMDVQEAIKSSGTYATDPDDYMGWGIPNFYGADSILTSISNPIFIDNFVAVYPNPFNNKLEIEINTDSAETISIELVSITGNIIFRKHFDVLNSNKKIILTSELASIQQGVYFLKVVAQNKTRIVKVIKS